MLTYQHLLACGADEKAIGEFICKAITQHTKTEAYRTAVDAERYDRKHIPEIEGYVKWLYTVTGRKIEDIWSPNFKLQTHFFPRFATQAVNYVLTNGVFFSGSGNADATAKEKEKLGKHFDQKLMRLTRAAYIAGRAWGFWNLDHLEVFHMAETDQHSGFCPLYDSDTGALMGGIRFHHRLDEAQADGIGAEKSVLIAELFTPSGMSKWRRGGTGYEEMRLLSSMAYITTTTSNALETVETGSNPDVLPIFELRINEYGDSELSGLREKIVCYCLIESGLANNVEEAAYIYWTIKNAGGMDDAALAQFVQRVKTAHAATVDDDAQAEAHTLDVPVEARMKSLETLEDGLYKDAQLLNLDRLSSAAKTAQEIRAAYQPQDNKAGEIEMGILEFLENLCALVGIDAVPFLRWNKIVNQTEETNMVMAAWELIGDEAAIRHLPFLTPEEAEQIIAQRQADDITRNASEFGRTEPSEDDEQEDGDG